MNESLKVSGKKFDLPTVPQKKWKFDIRPGGWIIAESPSGDRKRIAFWSRRKHFSLSMNGILHSGEWIFKTRESSEGQSADSDLVAQFPGKVRKILVHENSIVQQGVPLLLIEAMKMEFSTRAPFHAQVKRILVKEGQQLSPGDQLIDLEEIENGNS